MGFLEGEKTCSQCGHKYSGAFRPCPKCGCPAMTLSMKDFVAETENESKGKDKPSQKPAKSGCFVATACYGAVDCPEVAELRRFRDEVLLPRAFGRALVAIYYIVSPPIARWLMARQRLAAAIRHRILDRLVERVRANRRHT